MLLTVTPNAAIDRTYSLPRFALGEVNRPEQARINAGGKGINVARVYQTLGGRALTTGFLAGAAGRSISRSLGEEGIEAAFVRIPGESRACTAAISLLDGTQTEINESGPEVGPREVRALLRRYRELLAGRTFMAVALCGSLPPGCPASLFAEMIAIARDEDVRAALDTSGDALLEGLTEKPWLAKPNRVEAERALGHPVPGRGDLENAAHELLERGITVGAVTAGADGATLACAAGVWCAAPPAIRFASAVASGDAFLAGLLTVLPHEPDAGSAQVALRLATGAGAANAEVIGAGYCTRERIETLARQVVLSG